MSDFEAAGSKEKALAMTSIACTTAAAALPVLGAIPALVGEFAKNLQDRSKEERVYDAFARVTERIKALEAKLDAEYLKSDRLKEKIKKILEQIADEEDPDLRSDFTGMLFSVLKPQMPLNALVGSGGNFQRQYFQEVKNGVRTVSSIDASGTSRIESVELG